jgi:hypothetical protein
MLFPSIFLNFSVLRLFKIPKAPESMKQKLSFVIVTVLALNSAQAAVINGADYANDAAYNGDGWTNGDDGGTAGTFGAWTLTNTGANSGRFIGSSTSLGGPGADINTTSESFGMFGHSGQVSEAIRNFNGNTLGVGQTFSLEMAVNFRNGQKGFDLRNSSNTVIFNFNIGDLGAGDAYTVQFATSGNGSIGNAYSANTEFLLSFTQTSVGGGTWSITRSGGVSDLDSGTYTGVPHNFKFYEANTTGGGAAADNLFFNSLVVVPEPSSALLGGLGMLALLRRRRA